MQQREHLRFSTIVVLTLATSACASAGRASYDALGADYRTIETNMHAARSEDDRALSGDQLERAALIRAVLDRNPSVESARQAWRAALARYRSAGAYEDPMIAASFAPLSIGSSDARFGWEVELSQRVPLGGKLDAQAALVAAEAQVASSDYHAARLRLALVASQLYDDYLVSLRALAIQAQHVALLGALKQNAVVAFESGRASAQESLAAEAELARLEYQNALYEADRDVAIAQINALLHRDPDAPLPEPPAGQAPRDVAPLPQASELAQVVARRPDVAAAQAKVRVSSASVGVSDSAYAPDLMFSTSYSSMWDMPEHRWMAGVAVNIPLQQASRHGALDEARAMRAAAQSEVQSMEDAARSEVAVAARRMAAAERAVALYEQRLLPLARARIEAARAGLVTAQNDIMSVIEAEHGLRSAELELELSRADRSRRQAELEVALGRVPGLADQGVAP